MNKTKNRIRSILAALLLLGYLGYQYVVDPIPAHDDQVQLAKCVDGDTADFEVDGEIQRYRFLAIDTPETVHPKKEVEFMGPEASAYTCDALNNATNIRLEYEASTGKDKYNRELAWIFIDDVLLQEKLVANGYAKIAYEKDTYRYVNQLKKAEKQARENNLGIWEK